jgi:CelD/BcsL family acetyltransferase involved in cellulose biosynthesis
VLQSASEPDVNATAPDWEALAERAGAPPFSRPGWFAAWAKAFAPGELELLTVRRDDRLAGVVPILRVDEALRSPTNEQSHHFGLLAEDAAAGTELAHGLFSAGAARISLDYLDATSSDAPLLRSAAEQAGYRVVTRHLAYNLFLRLDTDLRLPNRLVRDIERRRRRLEQEGEVLLEVEESSERLDEGLRLEGSGWKDVEQTAILSRPDTTTFYREIADWAAARGWLRLSFLSLDGRPLAFQLALEHGGAHYFIKGGYDPAYHAFSPGKLLLHATLARAREHELDRYELLGDVEPWKLEWARIVRTRLSFQAFGRSPRSLAGYATRAYLRPLLRRDRRGVLLGE